MSKPKYPSTRADFVALPDNFTPVQSFDSSQVHGNTPLNTAIAQLLRAVINVGNIAALETDDKTNIVNAINEIIANAPIVKTSDNGFVIVADGANRANKATAQNAFAEGGKTEATGTSSHAEGYNTLAEGSGSHSEGQGTQAAGIASHAEGLSTLARGANSHVEGNYTETVDSSAHAEGESTVAYGIASHAEGKCEWSDIKVSRAYAAEDSYIYVNREVNPGFVISNNNTQTVGVQNCVLQEQDDYRLSLEVAFTEDIAANEILSVAPSAYGSYSHTEGRFTVAMGDSSHAEGSASKALGNYSHAEGLNTKTTNIAEHASGKYNKSTPSVTQFSVGIGADEEHRANAYEVTTDGKMYVKGVGGYDGTNVSDSSVDDLATAISQAGGVTDYDDLENKPIFQKEGERGYVLGNSNSATGLYSFAQGNGTYAIGDCSHAEGAAECVNNYLSSDYTAGSQTMNLAYIAYVGNIIIVDNQIAKILSVTGNPYNYTVYLDKPFASDISESTTIKIYPCASGTHSHTEGFNSMASGESSHAEGYNTKAQGTASHAEGDDTEASGGASHAEGYKSEATADCAHAEGRMTHATANAAHAEGQFTSANGKQSHAEGSNSSASADFSHAEGHYTRALGECSHAEGWNTFTRNKGEHACGRYNSSTTDVTLFSIGYGDEGQHGAPDTHQNAFEVDVNGNIYIKGIGGYDGTNITGTGVKSVQEVIAELAQQITTLQGGGNNS